MASKFEELKKTITKDYAPSDEAYITSEEYSKLNASEKSKYNFSSEKLKYFIEIPREMTDAEVTQCTNFKILEELRSINEKQEQTGSIIKFWFYLTIINIIVTIIGGLYLISKLSHTVY